MTAIKQYRKLLDCEFLEIIAQENCVIIAETEKRFLGLIADLPGNYFVDLVKAGRMFCSDIISGGEPLYRVFWQKQNGDLFVCVAIALSNRENIIALGQGIDEIARVNGCRSISFQTARLGQIAQAKSWGAEITGVVMKKFLT